MGELAFEGGIKPIPVGRKRSREHVIASRNRDRYEPQEPRITKRKLLARLVQRGLGAEEIHESMLSEIVEQPAEHNLGKVEAYSSTASDYVAPEPEAIGSRTKGSLDGGSELPAKWQWDRVGKVVAQMDESRTVTRQRKGL